MHIWQCGRIFLLILDTISLKMVSCISALFLSAPAAAPVQLSLGDACDPSNVTGICSSGTRCQNVSWVEYTDSGNGEYSDFVDASISHGLKYEYYVDHVEGYICTTDW